jgi:hypothetical protein
MNEWRQDEGETTWATKAARAAEQGGSLGASLGAAGAAPPAPPPGAAELPSDPSEMTLDQVREQAAAIRQRMDEIRAATEAEILKNWTSPWKGADMVATKVDARLATHAEFRAAMTRARDLQMLENRLDPDSVNATTGTARGGHPAIGR